MPRVSLPRSYRRKILWLIALGLGVYLLLPQLGEAPAALGAVARANPGWLAASLLAAALTYLLSALVLQAATPRRLSLRSLVLVQVASSFANRLAPGAVGGLALAIRFLQRQGSSVAAAATAATIARVGGVASAVVLVPILLVFVRGAHLHLTRVPTGLTLLFVAVGILLLVTAVLAVPRLRRRGRTVVREIASNVRAFLASGRVVRLLVLSFALTLAYGACLYCALLAVGVAPSIAHVLLVSLAGEGIATVAPTPGGIGATEATMASGLVILGVPVGPAIAGVLVYRAMTFWLPIVPGFLAFQRLTARGAV